MSNGLELNRPYPWAMPGVVPGFPTKHPRRIAVVFAAEHRRAAFWRVFCFICCASPLLQPKKVILYAGFLVRLYHMNKPHRPNEADFWSNVPFRALGCGFSTVWAAPFRCSTQTTSLRKATWSSAKGRSDLSAAPPRGLSGFGGDLSTKSGIKFTPRGD